MFAILAIKGKVPASGRLWIVCFGFGCVFVFRFCAWFFRNFINAENQLPKINSVKICLGHSWHTLLSLLKGLVTLYIKCSIFQDFILSIFWS